MDKIILTAHLIVKEDYADEAKNAIKELVEKTLQEKACLTYQLHQSEDNKNHFMLYEIWENKVGFQEHEKSEHFQKFIQKAPLFLSEKLQASFWKTL